MTVAEFTGGSLPDGWTAVEPANSSVDLSGDYVQLTIDANQTFDSTTSSGTGPEGPLIWRSVSGAFDFAVCLAEEAINLNKQGLDLLAIDDTMLGGIRFSNYRNNTGAHKNDCGWYVFGENAGTVVNTTGDTLMGGLYGGPSWLRMAFDGVDAWTVYGSMTGFSGSWQTIASFTDAFTPTRFALHAIAFPSGASGRVQRIQRVVDLAAVGSDDATTDPPSLVESNLYETDFASGSLPAWLTSQTNNGGTVSTDASGAELSVTATDQSYAWLLGPTDLPTDHGVEIEYQLTSAGDTNHFWVPIIALESTTDIAGAEIHDDKFGEGDGLILEMPAQDHAVAGITIRMLRTSPNTSGSSPTGNREFDAYTLLVEDTAAAVSTVDTPLTRLKLERADSARLRAKFWYAANSEPGSWDYEAECRMRHGTGMAITLGHNDGVGGTSSVRISYVRIYQLTASTSTALALGRLRRMTTYTRGTEGRLNDIMTTLGTTKASLWPFWEPLGTLVSGISVGDLTASETAAAAEALEDDFAPVQLPCGLYSYHFHPTGDHHLAGIDHNNYSFGNGTADSAFSVGAWIRPNAIATNVIMGKYDSAGNLEEWRFFIDGSGLLSLELHDASASATEIAVSDSALTIGQWTFVVAAYDGTAATPEINLYTDGSLANDGTTTETGAYVAMENTAAPLTIGCSGVTATPVAEFHGRMALPFVCGKQLTAAEVDTLYGYTAPMVGVT